MINCCYGCEREAKFTFKNGKHCCSKNQQQCSIVKNKTDRTKNKRGTGKIPWNKGLTKENDERVRRGVENLKLFIKFNHFKPKGRALTEEKEIERRIKISRTMKERGFGGYRRNSGRCKGFWYESIFAGKVFLRGSYELEYAKYLDKNNIKWKQNELGFSYNYQGKDRLYYPDFYLIDKNTYVEIKGFMTEQDEYKWIYFIPKLIILYKKDLLKLGCNVK